MKPHVLTKSSVLTEAKPIDAHFAMPNNTHDQRRPIVQVNNRSYTRCSLLQHGSKCAPDISSYTRFSPCAPWY